jgi:hypothetical protein
MTFTIPLEPLTRQQRLLVLVMALVCAATRFLARAESLWDWDEAQFILAMRDFDVARHQPHPPGFPLFIGLAKMLRPLMESDFRALQAVTLFTALFVFPAMFFFARELRLPFRTAFLAAAVFSFFPNVWFFGGTAFSDVSSIVLVLFAATLLLRGVRGRGAYWGGALLLGLAAAIRPQNLLVGMVPSLMATWRRRWWEALIGIVIGASVLFVAFGAVVVATGSWDRFSSAVQHHSQYIATVDSWQAEARPALWRLVDRFFLRQYQSPVLSIFASLFVLISLVGSMRDRDRSMLMNVLTFGPFALFAWLMLDRFSISRFSIGYQPMFAVFLADGVRRVGRDRAWVTPVLGASLVLAFAAYTFPALTPVRNEVAPPPQAVHAAVAQVDPGTEQLYVGRSMLRFMEVDAAGFPYRRISDDRGLPLALHQERAWLLTEVTDTGEEGFVFKRKRGNLWNIARRHYFEVKLHQLEERAEFLAGWYAGESDDQAEWRWMGNRSVTSLPPLAETSVLLLEGGLPDELAGGSTEIEVKLNGNVLERFRPDDGSFAREWRVSPLTGGRRNVLELSVSRTLRPQGDPRELGLRLDLLGWGRAH